MLTFLRKMLARKAGLTSPVLIVVTSSQTVTIPTGAKKLTIEAYQSGGNGIFGEYGKGGNGGNYATVSNVSLASTTLGVTVGGAGSNLAHSIVTMNGTTICTTASPTATGGVGAANDPTQYGNSVAARGGLNGGFGGQGGWGGGGGGAAGPNAGGGGGGQSTHPSNSGPPPRFGGAGVGSGASGSTVPAYLSPGGNGGAPGGGGGSAGTSGVGVGSGARGEVRLTFT